jgi:hypothetical protein
MLLYGPEPERRRRLTSLAVMTTMAAGHRDTPGSPTEHARVQILALEEREKD